MSQPPRWSEADDQLMRERYGTSLNRDLAAALGRSKSAVQQRARKLGLAKDTEFVVEQCRWASGHEPWNKGLRYEAGGNSSLSRFRPGRHPSEARNYRPIGSLRLSKDGTLQRKTTDDHKIPARRWVAVHQLVWEATNGPVPDGHTVVFRPGLKTTVEADITLDRLELVSRAELMRRNSVHRHGAEVAQLSQLLGAIRRQINRRQRAANTTTEERA